jgi:endoglucanase
VTAVVTLASRVTQKPVRFRRSGGGYARRVRKRVVLGAIAVVVVVAVVLSIVLSRKDSSSAGRGASAAEQFFDDYTTPDGQVIRRDQGGDTVSEGQAYAMQLAVDTDDPQRFVAFWTWTQQHLQNDEGLFAWRWQNGRVVDDQPAADADTDIARALVEAADRFDRPDYATEARRVASAVLDRESITVGDGRLVAAGKWAVDKRVVNPSYLDPCAYETLAAASGDQRWTAARDGALALLTALVADGLPPDWATLDEDGTPHAIASPDDAANPGRYGLDAARLPVRLSECPTGQALAAKMAPALRALDDDGAAVAYSLDGKRLEQSEHPLGVIANALAAGSAGETDRVDDLLDDAAELNETTPTYYGSAWIALADAIVSDNGWG